MKHGSYQRYEDQLLDEKAELQDKLDKILLLIIKEDNSPTLEQLYSRSLRKKILQIIEE